MDFRRQIGRKVVTELSRSASRPYIGYIRALIFVHLSQTRIPVPGYFLFFFGILAATVPFAIDAYLPAIPSMAKSFGVETVMMNYTISVFLLGYGIGQFFGGPVSDQVGRKRIGVIGMSVFLLSTLGILLSSSIWPLLVFRFLQAIGGGFTSVIIMATVRDVYFAHEAGRKYAVVSMIMLVMPILAPILGSQLLRFGWQWIFIALFSFVLINLLWYIFGIPETRPERQRKVDFGAILSQFREVIGRRNAEGMRPIMYVFSMALNVGALLSFVTNSSDIYQGYFGVSVQVFPFFFSGSAVLMIFCIRYSMGRMKTVHPHRLFVQGNLIQLFFSSLLLGYVIFFDPQLVPTFILIVLSLGTMGLTNPNGSAVYISHFDRLSGSATSFSSLILLFFGASVGALVGSFKDGTLMPFAIGVFTCILLSNLMSVTMPRPLGDFNPDS